MESYVKAFQNVKEKRFYLVTKSVTIALKTYTQNDELEKFFMRSRKPADLKNVFIFLTGLIPLVFLFYNTWSSNNANKKDPGISPIITAFLAFAFTAGLYQAMADAEEKETTLPQKDLKKQVKARRKEKEPAIDIEKQLCSIQKELCFQTNLKKINLDDTLDELDIILKKDAENAKAVSFSPQIHFLKGYAHYIKKNIDAAKNCFNIAIKRLEEAPPGDRDPLVSYLSAAHLFLGLLHCERADYANAEKSFFAGIPLSLTVETRDNQSSFKQGL